MLIKLILMISVNESDDILITIYHISNCEMSCHFKQL